MVTCLAEPLKFLSLMKGTGAGLWTTLGGAVAIVVILQLGLRSSGHLASPIIAASVARGAILPANVEAQVMFIVLVVGFAPALLVLLAWRKLMERRGIRTLFSAVCPFRWGLLIVSALVVAVLGTALSMVFDPSSIDDINSRLLRFSPRDWAVLALAYSVGIAIQATFEEVFVRGWLLQHVSRCVPNALVAVAITALAFTAMHYGHPGWATYVAAFSFGLAFGYSAIRLNGLEVAIGAHIANNLIGALFAGQMLTGNPPTMAPNEIALYVGYILGFLLFVECWARFFDKPSRA